jgi:hypothetical protein
VPLLNLEVSDGMREDQEVWDILKGLPVPTLTTEYRDEVEGDLELLIDAGKIKTLDGWRDVKFAVVARHKPGESITPSDWDRRDLPSPALRSIVAAVEEAEAFVTRYVTETMRLGLTDPKQFSVLGDGAEWIGNLAARRDDGASQYLDPWHGSGHLAKEPGRFSAQASRPRQSWIAASCVCWRMVIAV